MGHQLLYRRGDFMGELVESGCVVGGEQIGAHSLPEREFGELLGRSEAGQVVEAAHRPRVTPRGGRRFVHDPLPHGEFGGRHPGRTGQPPVGGAPDQPQHARADLSQADFLGALPDTERETLITLMRRIVTADDRAANSPPKNPR